MKTSPLHHQFTRPLKHLLALASFTLTLSMAPAQSVGPVASLQEQGVKEFFAGHIKESLTLWINI